jgi:PilZ domain
MPMAEERRIAQRRRILKAGFICVGNAIDCTVRNISDAGATLDIVSPLFIPDRFKLIIHSDGLNRPCHVVWRKERRMGIAFD